MALIGNFGNIDARYADASYANAFFPRVRELLYPRVAKMIRATSGIQPMPAIGSIGSFKLFTGNAKATPPKAYNITIPQTIFKLGVEFQQEDVEFDQTGSVLQIVGQMGIRLAEAPDNQLMARILMGSTASATSQLFRGVLYPIAWDTSTSFFSPSHADGSSNQIAGSLPTTIAALNAQDPGTSVKQLLQDFSAVINLIKTVKDEGGQPRFPTLSLVKNIIVVIPPCLEAYAEVAFLTPGAIAGGTVGSTTVVGSKMVKEVVCNGLLAGMPNPFTENGVPIAPLNPTDWYVLIDGDYTKPFGITSFAGLKDDDVVNAPSEDVISSLMSAYEGVSADVATYFASNRIDSNLNKLGNNSDWHSMTTEKLGVFGRLRGNAFYGPSFDAYRIYPTGGTANN